MHTQPFKYNGRENLIYILNMYKTYELYFMWIQMRIKTNEFLKE